MESYPQFKFVKENYITIYLVSLGGILFKQKLYFFIEVLSRAIQ